MQANETSRQKRAVEQLNFGPKTSKRVTWEAWEFTVVGSHKVKVTNASYGYLKEDHSYTVDVEELDDVAVPVKCECKADEFQEEYACKHRVALATIGGPTVMNAAVEFETPDPEEEADKLRADGGCECDKDEFPCFQCYLTERRELPE
jgi:hypothetical protein